MGSAAWPYGLLIVNCKRKQLYVLVTANTPPIVIWYICDALKYATVHELELIAIGATLELVDALQFDKVELVIEQRDENARPTVLLLAIYWLGIDKFKSQATFCTNVKLLLSDTFRLVI